MNVARASSFRKWHFSLSCFNNQCWLEKSGDGNLITNRKYSFVSDIALAMSQSRKFCLNQNFRFSFFFSFHKIKIEFIQNEYGACVHNQIVIYIKYSKTHETCNLGKRIQSFPKGVAFTHDDNHNCADEFEFEVSQLNVF